MEIEELKADLQKSIDDAGSALKSKAENAEAIAKKALDKAVEIVKQMTEGSEDQKKELDALRKDFNEMSANIAAKKMESKKTNKSWEEEFVEQYKAMEPKIKAMSQIRARQNEDLVFELNSTPMGVKAVTIGLDTTVEAVGSESQYTVTENTGIISVIRQRVLTYLQNVSTGAISKEYALWMEEVDEVGTPIFIGEGDAKTAISVRYEERNKKAKKIAVSAKVTMEFMEDLPQLMSYVQTNMMKRVDTVTENQLFNGNDTGDNLAGLVPYATAFTGGELAGTVVDANNWDVILGIISQVKAANGFVNAIFISNGYKDSLLATKASDGHYLLPAGVTYTAQGGLSAWGVSLIGTNALPSNGSVDFVGGDLSAVNVRFRKGMTISIGESGDDFINNLKTILVEQRLVQFVSANDTPVLVKGTFTAATALLEATT
tara:strand:+ start:28960 stop:30255 length:1296 start_codon:yes stop_codon:yes gene_type:complete